MTRTPTATPSVIPRRTWLPYATPTREDRSQPTASATASTTTPTPTPAITPITPAPLQILCVARWVDGLRIRSGPGRSFDVTDTERAGTVLALKLGITVNDGFWWREIDATGEWVAQLYIDTGETYLVECDA